MKIKTGISDNFMFSFNYMVYEDSKMI